MLLQQHSCANLSEIGRMIIAASFTWPGWW